MSDGSVNPIERAAAAGRAEAAAFLDGLRRREDDAFDAGERRLAEGPGEPVADDGAGSPTEVARLRAQVEALSAFRTAVLSSSAWRAIQAVRRVFGRAW